MKQTNNALKFLLAQYRSIFKNAFYKGLAPAIILTAGLAAAQSASADATAISADNFGSIATDKVVVSDSDPSYNSLNISGSADVSKVSNSGTFTLNIDSTSSAATISDIAVEAKNSDWTVGKDLSIKAGANNAGSLTVNSLTLNANLDVLASGGKAATVDANTININKSTVKLSGSGTATLGNNTSTITLNSGADVQVTASGSEAKILAGQLTLNKDSKLLLSGSGAAATLGDASSIITLNDGSAITLSSSGGATSAVINGTIIGNGGSLTVSGGSGTLKAATGADGAKLTINTKAGASGADGNALAIELAKSSSTLRLNSGSIVDLEASVSGTKSASGITLTKGTLQLDSGVNLTSKAATGEETVAGLIKVSGATAGNKDATLIIDKGVLDNFLVSNQLEGEDAADAAGAISVTSGTLLLTTADNSAVTSADLTKILYSGDAAQPGKVLVTGSANVGADTLSLDSKVGEQDLSNIVSIQANNLTLDASKFEADSGDKLSSFGVKDFNVTKSLTLNTSGSTFNVDKGTITLGDGESYFKQSPFTVGDTTYNLNTSTVTDPLTISGNAKTIHLGSDSTDGKLTVAGGNWVVSNLELAVGKSGALTISSTSAAQESGSSTGKYFNSGKVAALTLDSGSKLTLSSGTVSVSGASGAGALFDISAVGRDSFQFGANTTTKITVSGQPTTIIDGADKASAFNNVTDALQVGYGVMKVDGKNFLSQFVDDKTGNKAQLIISGGGVVYVSNSDTGTYDVKKFTSGTTTSGAVAFDGAGFLVFDKDFSLTTGSGQGDTGTSGDKLNIGTGTIVADTITLNNQYQVAQTAPEGSENAAPQYKYDDFTVVAGNLTVRKGLESNTDVVLGSGDNATLTLLGDASATGNVGANLKIDEGKLTLASGNWNAKNIAVASGSSVDIQSGGLDMGLLTAASGSTITTSGDTTFAIDAAQLDSGASVTLSGATTIGFGANDAGSGNSLVAADKAATSLDGTNISGATIKVETGGSLTLANKIMEASTSKTDESNATVTQKSIIVTKDDAGATTAVSLNDALKADFTVANGAELTLDISTDTAKAIFGGNMTADQALLLKKSMFGGDSYDQKLKGILNLGGTELDIAWNNPDAPDADKEVNWSAIQNFAQITGGDVTTNALKQATLVLDTKDAICGQFGALKGDASVLLGVDVNVNNKFGLWDADTINGTKYYAYKVEKDGSIAMLNVKSSAGDFNLGGGGNIGAVTVTGGDLNLIGGETIFNDVLNVGSIQTGSDPRSGSFNVTADTVASLKKDGTVVDLALASGATLNADSKFEVTGNNNILGNAVTSFVSGTMNVADTLTVKQSLYVADGAVNTKNLVLESGAGINVGFEPLFTEDNTSTQFDESKSYSGQLNAQYAQLNGGTLTVDPDYSKATALAAIGAFGSSTKAPTDENNAGTVDGGLFVGQNSALGLGTDVTGLNNAIAQFKKGQALDQNNYGSIVYVAKAITLGAPSTATYKSGIIMTASDVETFNKNMQTGATGFEDLANSNVVNDAIYFGANTALVVDGNALNKLNANAGSGDTGAGDTGTEGESGAAKAATGTTATSGLINFSTGNGTLIADGGDVVITGDVRANTSYQLFKDNDDIINVKNIAGETENVAVDIRTENGLLQTSIKDGDSGLITLGLDDARLNSVLTAASTPVKATLKAYAQGYNGNATDAASALERDKLYTYTKDADGNTVKDYLGYSNAVLAYDISKGNGASSEAVARFSLNGGVPQAALYTSNSGLDGVNARMGVGGAISQTNIASNGQFGNVWLSPVFKNMQSSSFSAEGLDTGVDLDVGGVTLGGDYQINESMLAGGFINVGSGTVDGKGNEAASSTSNDFDYFGVGAYFGFKQDALNLVADISYTNVGNDVSANTAAVGKIASSMDSNVLALGVTGQYSLDFNGTTLTPHAGLRYTNISLDDYSLDVNGNKVANFSADSMNVFSIPVGVSVSKSFATEAWTITPVADITLTGNFGDTDASGTTTWAGVENLSTTVKSEVLDSFTYGVSAGLNVQGANGLTVGVGVNYTGSSNTDEIGVNANARYVF